MLVIVAVSALYFLVAGATFQLCSGIFDRTTYIPNSSSMNDSGVCYDDDIETKVTEYHNELRRHFATKDINSKYGDIPGSKSLFKLKYDCGLADLAGALIKTDCSKSTIDFSVMGLSRNFRKFHTTKSVTEKDDITTYYNFAVEEWATNGIVPLESDVVYKDKSMQDFANMIYYKSIAFGCMHKYCEKASSFAIACVYGSAPKIGEPLYIPNPQPKNKKGCAAHKTCRQVVSDSECMTKEDGTLGPLCETDSIEVEVSAQSLPQTSHA